MSEDPLIAYMYICDECSWSEIEAVDQGESYPCPQCRGMMIRAKLEGHRKMI